MTKRRDDREKLSLDESQTSESVDRRAFLKTTALAASGVAGLAVAGATSGAAAQEKPAPQEQPTRGSELLLEKLGAAGKTFSVQDLRQVIGVAKKYNIKIIDWCQYGQPAVDGLCGTFEVRPDLVGSVLGDLLRLDPVARLGIDVFPLGIPVIDLVRVAFRAGRVGVGR